MDREKKILERLKKQGSAAIQELADYLGVSSMTIHRDIRKLVDSGQIDKKHGGVSLSVRPAGDGDNLCAMCNKPLTARTIFILRLENGSQKKACCAHCGLMLQSEVKTRSQSLSVDYLHGHMVSANQAYYLLGSDLKVCCIPSILSFGSREEAGKFHKGFGGTIARMDAAVHYLHDSTRSPK